MGNDTELASFAETNKKISTLFRKKIDKVIAWKEDKIVLLDPVQILYFTASDGKTTVITSKGVFEVRNTLNYWEERMSNNNFFRCHRSFLINLNKIEMILPMFGNTYDIKLAGCSEYIPVSMQGNWKVCWNNRKINGQIRTKTLKAKLYNFFWHFFEKKATKELNCRNLMSNFFFKY